MIVGVGVSIVGFNVSIVGSSGSIECLITEDAGACIGHWPWVLWGQPSLSIQSAPHLNTFHRLLVIWWRILVLRVFILDAASIVVVAATHAPSSSPAAPAITLGLITAHAEAEEDGREEEGSPGAPCETEGIATESSVAAGVFEGVSSEDEGGAIEGVSEPSYMQELRGTYVMRDMATLEQKSANMEMNAEMAAPSRPQQARKPEKKAMTSKKRVIRKKTQPNRQRKKYLFEVVSSPRPPTSEEGALSGLESQAFPKAGAGRAFPQSSLS